MNRQERYEVARRNAERARTRNDQSPKTGHMQQREDPDQTGETKPEETMYDPLYPKENPNRKNRRKR